MKKEKYIDIHFCDHAMPVFFREERVRGWIDSVIQQEGRKAGILSFIICDDEFLIKLNREYLHHDFFTDVITFDYSDDLDGVSGDVYISIDRVEENAREIGVRFPEELYRVMIHGVLHLLGYTDKDEQSKRNMQDKENYYLSLFV